MPALEIKDLWVSTDGKEILKGVSLKVETGEIHALMGPNGSGKSTLAHVIMGHPRYKVERGEILYKGKNLLELSPDERAKLGIFLAFQYPLEIEGVALSHFLWSAYRVQRKERESEKPSPEVMMNFRRSLREKTALLELKEDFLDRYINVGFSGGEKKRAEILQMMVLEPEIAILDETDSGLDIDSVKVVAEAINKMRSPSFGALLITHYQRILHYVKPDFVHVMVDGKIVMSGGPELALELEKKGYGWLSEGEGGKRDDTAN
jgi:Fe-S cluster assembly ATP-binding protein